MANGDIAHADIEAFLQFGENFPTTSTSTFTETEVDGLCTQINADVNLVLKRLAFNMPITDTDSLAWLQLTKTFGASALVLEGLMAQDTEEGNTRAGRLWRMYEDRLRQLWDSGGDILDAARDTSPRVNTAPTLVGENDAEARKRFLRFPQRAAADHYDNDYEVARTRANWKHSIRGW